MVNIAFVVLDSLAIFLVVVPMPWHMSAWNTATCYMMIWTVLGCIIHLVNSIVWSGNLSNPSPIYCDISTKLLMGISIAIPLSSLCINRRLYNIATMTSVTIGKAQKRRDAIIDTLIAVLGPMIFMAVHYTQQGHRYDIIEDYGCWPTTYLTALGYVFVICPPIVVCAISLVYCTLSIRAFIKRRHDFNSVLRSSSTGLNPHRYFRLMALASAEILLGLPASLYFFVTDLKVTGVQPWISWEDTHWAFSRIVYYPTFVIRVQSGLQVALELDRWTFPFIAFLFFAFFGLSDDARSNYRIAFFAILKPFGVRPKPTSTQKSSTFGGKSLDSRGPGKLSKSLDDDDIVLPPQYSIYARPDSDMATSPSFLQLFSSPLPTASSHDMHVKDVDVPQSASSFDTPIHRRSLSFDLSPVSDSTTLHDRRDDQDPDTPSLSSNDHDVRTFAARDHHDYV